MSIYMEILILFLGYAYSFVLIRWFLWGVKEYSLNASMQKKRKKGETLKEWFLYSRYREEIPKPLLVLYFFILLIHPFGLICRIVFFYIESLATIGALIDKSILIFDLSWKLIIDILFWRPGKGYAYARWLTKKGGNKKRRK